MAETVVPQIARLVPPKGAGMEEENPANPTETPATTISTESAPIATGWARPAREKMNLNPRAELKAAFEDAAYLLKANNRQMPLHAVHDAALAFVMENWDEVVQRVMESGRGS